jgi:hypothetical protein
MFKMKIKIAQQIVNIVPTLFMKICSAYLVVLYIAVYFFILCSANLELFRVYTE